jgi:DNA-binding XRE family transcriptional regulator
LIFEVEQLRNTIESGKYQPSLELAFELAQTFGKRVDEMFVFVDGVSA